MIRFLLDTSICIEIIRGRSARVIARLEQQGLFSVGISVITLAELELGVNKSAKPDQNRTALSEFCGPLVIAEFDSDAARAYGEIRGELERKGNSIGPLDLLIAAHACALDAALVTNNEREFRRIKGLHVENWLRA